MLELPTSFTNINRYCRYNAVTPIVGQKLSVRTETQCIAEELIESAISAACEEMASEIAENLRLQKLKDAENEISQENLVRPSELLAQQRRNRKSPPKEIAKPTQKLPKENPQPTQDIDEQTTQNSTEKQEKSNAETESNSVPIQTPPPPQEELSNIPKENLSQSEIEIPEEIPKSEPEIPSSVSEDEVSPVTEDNRAENNSPPEVINEQSPAVIKSTKEESRIDSKNSSQSMTSSIPGISFHLVQI